MKKTVLLVEDDPALIRAVKTKLEKSDFAVVCATTAREAIDHLENGPSRPVDVVWLDHYLLGPGTGLDVLEKAKNDAKYKDTPTFIVSNTASPEKRRAYLQLGATRFYIKAEHRLEDIVADIQSSLSQGEAKAAEGNEAI